ncbi:segregation/condensation protein A [Waterburya agarophytonicola K14]|uniref:Segregation and condensation protein A n=1 Tax=Waterburya agarophytonicola KI4 TaxID=2874699 RepID=A0A964BP02_9CYAN|nr:segregation/condensation protein A [Waterburya agarophytonicola]MCC0175682.1 segregation/condensation protein A [Waterburya agarophytonicola KI4]
MTITPAQEAIANLINLAEKGEIDPWDVPVIEIIDRFLAELGLIGETESPQQEADLPRSGQAFLWASMLVLFKADSLHLLQEELLEIEEEEFFEEEYIETEKRSLPANLEQHIRRRTSAQPVGKRRVTLQELIEQLEHIAAEIEAAATDTSPKRSQRSRSAAIKAIAQLAHNENLTELAAQLESFLYLNLAQLASDRDYVDWENLLERWHTADASKILNQDHSPNSDLDRAGVFWALLLLSAQSKVELVQEEFYQDLSVRPLNSCVQT